jgi:DNA topoisomerase-2
MAQNYVGSNNVNLLVPNGQFGTRLQGGDDSASERYIFTMLNSLTRSIFPISDDSVLDYVNDDGTIVEPEFYVPIIPFCLMNGISGIGTGFSCSIPSYNPKQIIRYLIGRLSNSVESIDFIPYYEGFKGKVEKIGDQKYLIRGTYEKVGEDKIRITELPIGTWTMPYITFLEGLMDGSTDKSGKKISPTIKDMISMSTEVSVDITVTFPKGKLIELESTTLDNEVNGLEKMLKLTTTVSTTNMYMFNSESKLHKYDSVQEIIDDFFKVRMVLYKKRKDALVVDMRAKLEKLSMRAKYIQETLCGKIDLRKKTAEQVTLLLDGLSYVKIDGDFKYLIKMPMDSVTEENVDKIMKEKADTEMELDTLLKTSLERIWLNELSVLDKEYDAYKIGRELIQSGSSEKKKTVVKKTVKK